MPAVEGTWHYNPSAKRVEIELAQTGAGEPCRLPMEIALAESGAAAPKIAKIEMTVTRQKFEIAMDKEPSAVELDPHTWLPMDARLAGN